MTCNQPILPYLYLIPWKGPLHEIYSNTLKELPKADANLVFAVALSVLGHEANVRIKGVLGGYSRTNINLFIVGPPASGKTRTPSLVFSKLNMEPVVSSRSSAEGLAKVLGEYGEAVHFVDEAHQVFRGRRKDNYVGDLVDVWKSSFYSLPMFLARAKKSIKVSGDFMLTVVLTSTFEDIENITDILDEATLRRFLPVITKKQVDPLVKGEEADWKKARETISFLREFGWEAEVEVTDKVLELRDKVLKKLGHGFVSSLINEYMVKIAVILALDNLVSVLYKLIEEYGAQGKLFSFNLRDDLKTVLQEVVREDFSTTGKEFFEKVSFPLKFAESAEVAEQKPGSVESSALSQLSVQSSYMSSFRNQMRNQISSIINSVLNSAEEVLKSCRKVAESTAEPAGFANVVLPLPELSLRGNILVLNVPEEYLMLGLYITLTYVKHGLSYLKLLGSTSEWSYFLRKVEELSRKYGLLDRRIMLAYMKKLSRRQLDDVIRKAVEIGVLEAVSIPNARAAKFKVNLNALQ